MQNFQIKTINTYRITPIKNFFLQKIIGSKFKSTLKLSQKKKTKMIHRTPYVRPNPFGRRINKKKLTYIETVKGGSFQPPSKMHLWDADAPVDVPITLP